MYEKQIVLNLMNSCIISFLRRQRVMLIIARYHQQVFAIQHNLFIVSIKHLQVQSLPYHQVVEIILNLMQIVEAEEIDTRMSTYIIVELNKRPRLRSFLVYKNIIYSLKINSSGKPLRYKNI